MGREDDCQNRLVQRLGDTACADTTIASDDAAMVLAVPDGNVVDRIAIG